MIERYKALFQKLLAELPAGSAKFNEYPVPKSDSVVIELLPANQRATSFGVHLDSAAEFVDFSFGRLGTWELPMEGRNRDATPVQLLSEVEQMARAVIAGSCEETRGLFSLTSRIFVADFTYKVVDLPMLPIPPFGTHHYKPFVTE